MKYTFSLERNIPITLGLFFILASTTAAAQSNYKIANESGLRYRTFTYYYNNAAKLPVEYSKTEEYIVKKGIDTLTMRSERVKKNGRVKYKSRLMRYIYNENGEVKRVDGLNKKNDKLQWYTLLTYDANGHQHEVISYDKTGLQTLKQVYLSIDSTRGYRLFYKIDKSGDTMTKVIVGGIDTNRLVSADYYYFKGKLKYTWHNEYYPNKSRKRCTFYRKGKEKYVWDYQCRKEGIEIKKHKDTSKVCVNKELDQDSILTTTYHTVQVNGVLEKVTIKTNKYYQRLYYKRMVGTDDVMQLEETYQYATDGKTLLNSEVTYYKKNEIANIREKMFDENGDETKNSIVYYKKGVLYSRYTTNYEYDTDSRPIKCISTSSKDGSQLIDYYMYN
ncbi:MAG: hypothetical protein ACI9M3_000927 [Bacteroidia bacterium]|jgi:hypothetical protein